MNTNPPVPSGVIDLNAAIDGQQIGWRTVWLNAAALLVLTCDGFDLATIRPFVEKYLASLPSTGQAETWKDVGITDRKSVV